MNFDTLLSILFSGSSISWIFFYLSACVSGGEYQLCVFVCYASFFISLSLSLLLVRFRLLAFESHRLFIGHYTLDVGSVKVGPAGSTTRGLRGEQLIYI